MVGHEELYHQESIEYLFNKTEEYLTLLGKNGMLQNQDKFVFCQKSVPWAEFQVSNDSVELVESHRIEVTQRVSNTTERHRFEVVLSLYKASISLLRNPTAAPTIPRTHENNSPWYWDSQFQTGTGTNSSFNRLRNLSDI